MGLIEEIILALAIISENFVESVTILSIITSGVLIFFYLKKIKELKINGVLLFDSLMWWDELLWIGVVSFINLMFAWFVWIFTEVISFLILSNFGSEIIINSWFIFMFATFLIPLYFYAPYINPTNKQQLKAIELFLIGISTLVVLNAMLLQFNRNKPNLFLMSVIFVFLGILMIIPKLRRRIEKWKGIQ